MFTFDGFAHLNVAISRIGSRGAHTHGQKLGVRCYVIKALQHLMFEAVGMQNQLVGRGHHHIGIGIGQHGVPGAPNGCRSRVELYGFGQYVFNRQRGQLLFYQIHVALVGRHKDMVERYETGKTLKGLLQQGAAGTKKVDELFGHVFAAGGPEPTSHATGKYDAIIVIRLCFHFQ